MNFGLLFAFRNPPSGQVPFAELYRKQFDLASLAEDLGYDTIWLTEHHFIDDGYSPSLLPIAAAIAARTRRIRIGTFVIFAPAAQRLAHCRGRRYGRHHFQRLLRSRCGTGLPHTGIRRL